MKPFDQSPEQVHQRAGGLDISDSSRKVLRNTYTLLALNLATSAAVAGASMMMNLPHPGIILLLVGVFGLSFLITKFRNSAAAIPLTFAFTSFLGYSLGPILGMYLGMAGGSQIVMMALGGTALTFATVSAWSMVTKTDLSGMGSYLFIGIIVAFALSLVAYFFSMPALSIAVSAMFVLLMTGLIAYQTQQIVNGGETNYVMATVTLFMAIYNLFVSLLSILGFANSD